MASLAGTRRTYILNGIRAVYRGPWDPEESYLPGDLVTHDSGYYLCVRETAGPPPPPENTAWVLFWGLSEVVDGGIMS